MTQFTRDKLVQLAYDAVENSPAGEVPATLISAQEILMGAQSIDEDKTFDESDEEIVASALAEAIARTKLNDWDEDIDLETDRVVAWGCGESSIKAIRNAGSDYAYATARARAWFARCINSEASDRRSDADAWWIVSLSPSDVSPSQLDRDSATVGYEVVSTNG